MPLMQSLLPFFYDYVLPALIIAGLSALLLVVLLVLIAFLLLMDRKVWAAVQSHFYSIPENFMIIGNRKLDV